MSIREWRRFRASPQPLTVTKCRHARPFARGISHCSHGSGLGPASEVQSHMGHQGPLGSVLVCDRRAIFELPAGCGPGFDSVADVVQLQRHNFVCRVDKEAVKTAPISTDLELFSGRQCCANLLHRDGCLAVEGVYSRKVEPHCTSRIYAQRDAHVQLVEACCVRR